MDFFSSLYIIQSFFYLTVEPGLSILPVLLSHEFILVPHIGQDLGQVNAWSRVQFDADLASHLSSQGTHFLSGEENKRV